MGNLAKYNEDAGQTVLKPSLVMLVTTVFPDILPVVKDILDKHWTPAWFECIYPLDAAEPLFVE